MFRGFESKCVDLGDVTIHFAIGGRGPGLLLLHGNPQTHAMWHKIAPALAKHFTVVAADLRGQGDSSKPRGEDDHSNYSKRTMAHHQVELMGKLGFESFSVAGHDRGARVAHRLVLDHPDRVDKVAFLDIVPTLEMYEQTNRGFALLYWSNFFYAQPADLPETMIASDPKRFVESNLFDFARNDRDVFAEEAVSEYIRCFSDSAAIHAACEDYRASFSVDLGHDSVDRGRRIEKPALALWGANGVMERCFDVIGMWRNKASNVTGKALDAGHYLAEEQPEVTTRELLDFFAQRR